MQSGYFVVSTTFLSILVQNSGRCSTSLRQFISDRDYAIYDVAPTLKVTPVNVDSVADAWTADISRFALAAFESMASIQTSSALPRSLAWSCIKAYYAAYFAAHSLLRFAGTSITTFDSSECNSILSIAQTYLGATPRFSKGARIVRLAPNGREMEVTLAPEPSSHVPVWQSFDLYLSDTLEKIAGLPTSLETQEAISELSDLVNDLRLLGGGATALSRTRNDINYRQLFNVWYPYRSNLLETADLVRMIEKWTTAYTTGNALTKSNNNALKMVDLSTRIVQLCRDSIMIAASEHAGSHSFLNRKVLPFLNLI